MEENSTPTIVMVDINEILPNRFQPRIEFDEEEILGLSSSIKEHGIINPILVRKINSLIHNAAFIKTYLINSGYKYSFKYSKFVWGEILRNLNYLEFNDIILFYKSFTHYIGFSINSLLAKWYCILKKIIAHK